MILYQKAFSNFKENYLGYIPLLIIGQSCIGSAAVMYILEKGISTFQMIQLGVIVCICMLVNVSVLSQQEPKLVYNLTIISVFLSAIEIVFNLLF
jgi:hypothetical protein